MLHLISNFQNAGKGLTQIVTSTLTHGLSPERRLEHVSNARTFWEISKRLKIRIGATGEEKQKVDKIFGNCFFFF